MNRKHQTKDARSYEATPQRIVSEQGIAECDFFGENWELISFGAPEGWASRAKKSWHRTPEKDLFRECQVQTNTYRQSQVEGWEAFFGAACAGIESPEKTDLEFAQFEAINREVFDAFSANGKIQLDYETRVSFAQPLQHI